MISRGEVALIVASKGAALGLMVQEFFAPVVIVVVVTTIITPVLLKLVYKYQAAHYEDPVYNTTLVDRMQEKHQIEMVTQKVADIHEDIKLEKNKEEQAQKI